ncbi:MAG: L,D-transpeptidase [Acidimicrobiales bacterium]
MDLTRRRVLTGLTASAVGAGALGVVAAGRRTAAPVEAQAAAVATSTTTEAPAISGSWPTTTTTTLLPGLDPATGIGVSGPIGPPWPDSFTVGDAIVPSIPIFSAPDVPVPTGRTLPNPTVEGYKLVVLVREQRGNWLQVQINTRPNGATAWIRTSDVALRTVPNHILIELAAKRLTVFHGEESIFSTSVAPGKAASPTPTGAFYVDILTRPANPGGPYGPFQVSVTGFSNVYDSFGGGNGQIAIHGTNRPELIGTPASHGCVRMSNDDITTLVPLARQGTPVVIVP